MSLTTMVLMTGYCLYLAEQILGWSIPEIHVFCAHLRRELRNRKLHPIFRLRCVYAQKPVDAPVS